MAERCVYLVRHGVAEDYADSGRDFDRALTDEGRQKNRRSEIVIVPSAEEMLDLKAIAN